MLEVPSVGKVQPTMLMQEHMSEILELEGTGHPWGQRETSWVGWVLMGKGLKQHLVARTSIGHQKEPLPGGCMYTSLTSSLEPDATTTILP